MSLAPGGHLRVVCRAGVFHGAPILGADRVLQNLPPASVWLYRKGHGSERNARAA